MALNIETLKLLYLESAQKEAQDIDISDLSDFQAKAAATAGVGAGISIDAERLFNQAFPQYSTQLGINAQLAASGLSPQLPSAPSLLTLSGNNLLSGKSYNIPVSTFITATGNSQIYKIVSFDSTATQVVITSDSNVFYASSLINGGFTGQNIGTTLTFTPPIVSTDGTSTLSTCTVTANLSGADQESLSSATNRLIEAKQTPLDLTRATDYKNKVIEINKGSVTNAQVLTNKQIAYSGNDYNCGIFLAGGSDITDSILNQGLVTGTTAVVFNRQVNESIISTTQQQLVAEYIIGSRPNVNNLSTQGLTTNTDVDNPFIRCGVTLQNGYSLDSKVTLDGNVFTIYQLVQREIRRAICLQPFGATLDNNISNGQLLSSKLLMSAIQSQLDNTLGTSNSTGTLGAYLVNRVIYVKDGVGSYTQPPAIDLNLSIPTSSSAPLAWVYDISLIADNIYSNIGVVTL